MLDVEAQHRLRRPHSSVPAPRHADAVREQRPASLLGLVSFLWLSRPACRWYPRPRPRHRLLGNLDRPIRIRGVDMQRAARQVCHHHHWNDPSHVYPPSG